MIRKTGFTNNLNVDSVGPLIYAENRGQQVTTAGFGDVYCPRGKVQRVEDRERNLQEGGYERKKPDVENWGAHLEKTSLVVKHQKVVDWAEISKVYSLKRANQKVKVENWAANWKGDGLEGNEQISVDWTRDGWARTQRGRGQCNGRGVHDAPVSPVNFNRSTATIPISSRRIYYT